MVVVGVGRVYIVNMRMCVGAGGEIECGRIERTECRLECRFYLAACRSDGEQRRVTAETRSCMMTHFGVATVIRLHDK